MVTIDNGTAEPLTADEIYANLEAALLAEGDYDTSDGSVFDSILTAAANTLANQQEQALVDVYEGAFLDTATGEALENVVSVIGLSRQSPVNATGTVTFDHGSFTDQTYTIPSGTTVETTDGVSFDTTEAVEIPYFDGYERSSPLNDYSGDVGSYSVSSTYAKEGSNSLHATSAGNVWRDGLLSSRGMTHQAHVYFDSGSAGTKRATFRYIGESNQPNNGYAVVIDADNNEVTLTGTTSSATIPTDEWLRIETYADYTGEHTISLYDSGDNELTTFTYQESNYPDNAHEGVVGLGANSDAVYWDEIAAKDVGADIRAADGGPAGNVGRGAITVIASPVSGVNSIRNLQATGDTDNRDTDGDVLIAGTPAETDAELRERAKRVSGEGGAASIDALLGAVLDVEDVRSVRIFENDTDSTQNGLPPVSFEIVVNGGSSQRIARAIFDDKAATARDFGGNNGTADSATVEAVNGQSFTMNFSRPNTLAVDASLDIVVDGDNYGGDRAVRQAVVNYIGGTGVDGGSIQGLGVGENVIVNEVESRVQDVPGVIGVDSSDSSYTPSTTTGPNGLEVVSVGANEVAETDGSDGSISLSITKV